MSAERRRGRALFLHLHLGLILPVLAALGAAGVLVGGPGGAGTDGPPGRADPPSTPLARPHETSLSASQEYYSGSSASFRCEVRSVKSITETVPLADALVEARLLSREGKAYPLFTGKTNTEGKVRAVFQVPRLAGGEYTLEVATKSSLGSEKLTRAVRIKDSPRVLLVTDKPLYQPGQVVHIRALCLRPFDLTPVAGSDLTFEVEDPKGNKVFKRVHKTSPFGVAAVDFQLAEEINMGDYQVRALLGEQPAQKTVTVKRYVLPKFKVGLTTDKKYYLTRETIQADLQGDYFFGKPVANGKIKVTASTFDVQFKDFQTWEGTTDANGHAKFEIRLPDYFVGQPLQKGDALVKLEVKLTDTADHAETVNRTYPVAPQAIRVSLIPEGGRLIPGMENRIFVAALYPDGSPVAACDVQFWKGSKAQGKPHTRLKTNEAGLAEFRLTPKPEEFRQGEWVQRNVEMVGGNAPQAWEPRSQFDVAAEARDAQGNAAQAVASLNGEPFGENILLRLDRAIYRSGDVMNIEVQTSAGMPTSFLDIVKGGQTLLTRWLEVKDGKAHHKLDLPQGIFGTLEVHAYQQLASGEIIRDCRVVYVHSRDDLKIEVRADRDVYLPGQSGTIRFQVSDSGGKPLAAALGIIVVDEAVYALQEMQPGLEKVYFTLQEELLKPQAQLAAVQPGPVLPPVPPGPGPGPVVVAPFRPADTLDGLVRRPELPADKQQIAEVLLTAVKPRPPALWQVDPAVERLQKVQAQIQQIGWAIYGQPFINQEVLRYDPQARRWTFHPDLLETLVKKHQLPPEVLKDPFGKPLVLEDLQKLEKNFTPERLGRSVTMSRIQQLGWGIISVTNQNRAGWFRGGQWYIPASVLGQAARNMRQGDAIPKDAWGGPIQLVRRDKKLTNPFSQGQFDFYELVSAGPDGKLGTQDDVRSSDHAQWALAGRYWLADNPNGMQPGGIRFWRRRGDAFQFGPMGGFGGAARGMPIGAMGGVMAGPIAEGKALPLAAPMALDRMDGPASKSGAPAAAGPPVRLREFFPETMLWQPLLLTDDQGRAELPLSFADSITTWRLSASASSRGGALGGLAVPLRVFQDFFVDLDLPVSLTQNDEVAFPVAVYNYLKEPQTVRLDLQRESWFDLVDEQGFSRTLDLKPGDVTSVKFRIKARRIGQQPLTIKAVGSKMSDAVKRSIEVVPDGKKIEQVVSDRLAGRVRQTLQIPDRAIPESYKLLVKIYPGVFSQVMEGTEGMLRMPGG